VIVIDVGKALLAVGILPGLALPLIGIDPAVDRDCWSCAARRPSWSTRLPGLVRIPRGKGRRR